MYRGELLVLLLIASLAIANGKIFNFEKLENYTRLLGFGSPGEPANELWHGIVQDCSRKVSFSCIQKNAYTYLDRTFIDRDNITIFDGLRLTRNNLDYDACGKVDARDNLVEDGSDEGRIKSPNDDASEKRTDEEYDEEEEHLSPLEEVTHALRKKTLKFLATRDYEVQLPRFLAGGASFKISPREIDENGALVRIDFGNRAIDTEQQHGRLFLKKIKKQIQNKLLTTLLLLILIIKIIKIKFLFVIPFLFGVGTAKKLFLKLLLFLVPAFGHVFKLCSSYYSSHATRLHLHQHKIAHHHHHIPVPVPVPSYSKPVYYDHPPPSSPHGDSSPPYILDEDFKGYDYAHPHIQYRKDIEELKEWGIEPYDEPYDQVAPQAGVIHPSGPGKPGGMPPPHLPPHMSKFPGPYQYAANAKPLMPPFLDKGPPLGPPHPQSLAYAGYGPPRPPGPVPANSLPVGVVAASGFGPPPKPPVTPPTKQQNFGLGFAQPPQQQQQQQQQPRPVYNQQRHDLQPQPSAPAAAVPVASPPTRRPYDDDFYGPIVERLDEIFGQLRFLEESCRERLVCSMYKNPALYSPHSNLVSNELSRDPQELQQGNTVSVSSQRFHRYLNAARLGQDGGDCLRAFPCSINTE